VSTRDRSRQSEIDQRYGLEPVFEPGQAAGSDALEDFVEVRCPYCDEPITVRIDLSAGAQSYVEDCQVCCQPMLLSVTVDGDGLLDDVRADRS
jgi:hypothetical protein